MKSSEEFINFLGIVLVAPLLICGVVAAIGHYITYLQGARMRMIRMSLCFSHAKMLAKKGKMFLINQNDCHMCKRVKK